MPDKRGRDHRGYRKKAERIRRNAQACWLCGLPIDHTLHWKDPMAATADHLTPLAQGGTLHGEMKAAHRSCNSKRGDGTRQPNILKASRQW